MKNKINFQIRQLNEKIRQLNRQISNKIKTLPDNPSITRISSNAFIMSFKDLKNNWTPEYYDFKEQYKIIANYLKSSNNVPESLNKIIKDGFIIKNQYKIHFHPQVIQYLKTL
jgi:regulator of replication initiation timing